MGRGTAEDKPVNLNSIKASHIHSCFCSLCKLSHYSLYFFHCHWAGWKIGVLVAIHGLPFDGYITRTQSLVSFNQCRYCATTNVPNLAKYISTLRMNSICHILPSFQLS